MRHGNLAANGRNINDAASAPDAHFGNDSRNQFEGRPKMQSHCALEILPRHMLERADFDNAGVVYQDVYLAKAIDDLPNSRLNLFGIEKIAFNRENFATAGNK